jgi:hypothetical protein
MDGIQRFRPYGRCDWCVFGRRVTQHAHLGLLGRIHCTVHRRVGGGWNKWTVGAMRDIVQPRGKQLWRETALFRSRSLFAAAAAFVVQGLQDCQAHVPPDNQAGRARVKGCCGFLIRFLHRGGNNWWQRPHSAAQCSTVHSVWKAGSCRHSFWGAATMPA